MALGFWLTAGNDLNKMQTPKQKVLFPTDLVEVWSQATINGEPLLTYTGDLVEAEPVVAKKPWFTPQVCGILLIVLALGSIVLIIIRKRRQ